MPDARSSRDDRSAGRRRGAEPSHLRVRLEQGDLPPFDRTFADSFRIGRDAVCEVQLATDLVSRVHAEVRLDDGQWWVADLQSTNGTYVDGARIERVRIGSRAELRLARQGPVLELTVEGGEAQARWPVKPGRTLRPGETKAEAPTPEAAPARLEDTGRKRTGRSVDDYVQHYLKAGGGEPAGDHTVMIRRAFATVHQRQRRRYAWMIAVTLLAAVVIGAYALLQRQELRRQQEAASTLFYELKELDLQIAQVKAVVESSGSGKIADQLQRFEESRQRLAQRYEGYVRELGLYRKLTEEEKLIHKVALAFNESELVMPAGFVRSVQRTIASYWRSTEGHERYAHAIHQAEKNGYIPRIVGTLRKYGLPPQFFYLPLQESNFNVRAIGPPTRWGRAKGMWQLIPSTAKRYNLDPGPYADSDAVDLQDERLDFGKSTETAARYLQTIYSTLAQASGLLVVASYNWGEHRVVDKLEQLPGPQAIPMAAFDGIPEDPKSRNYWRFLVEYRNRMPDETMDYVLKIFSAAVIGENPRLFGFDFDNPLRRYVEQTS